MAAPASRRASPRRTWSTNTGCSSIRWRSGAACRCSAPCRNRSTWSFAPAAFSAPASRRTFTAPPEPGSEDLAHLVLRAAEADALVGFDERALDQDRVRRHRLENNIVRGVRRQAELSGARLLGAQAFTRREPGTRIEAAQLVGGRRLLQIIADGDLGALLLEDREGLARGAAAW